MCYIVCKESKKSNKKYLVLVVNGVFVSFDRFVIEKLAMTIGVSNLELQEMKIDDKIEIV